MGLVGAWWRPPALEGDEASERSYILHRILVAGAALLVVALVVSVALRPLALATHFPYAATLLAHLVALALLRYRRPTVAVVVFSVFFLAVVMVSVLLHGGMGAPPGLVLPPLVLLVGLSWSGRAALVTALVASLALLGLALVEESVGLPAPRTRPTPLRLWLVVTTTLAMTAVLLHVALGILSRSRQALRDKERARRALEDRLAQSRRLEVVGRLAAGVAHDFNNLLTIIFAQTSLLRRSADPRVLDAARETQDAAERAAALTRQLLAFGRRQVLEPAIVDLNAVVRELQGLLARFVGDDVRLAVQLAPVPALVRADRTQLEQVLLNLVTNARDAMPQGGALEVRVGVDAGEVTVRVTDTGVGMRPEVMAHIFEPFFTTKARGKGTGLGLAMVHGIVEQSGGRVDVESVPGQGSTFTVVLPQVAEVEAEAAAPRAAAVPAPAAAATHVLVVDDDPQVREATAMFLREAGYQVRAVGTPEAALRAAAEGEPPALLVTDVIMPGSSGPELARRLRARLPGLRVLFISGYSEEQISTRGFLSHGVHFLAKPFEAAALRAKVAAVLTAEHPGALGATEPAPASVMMPSEVPH